MPCANGLSLAATQRTPIRSKPTARSAMARRESHGFGGSARGSIGFASMGVELITPEGGLSEVFFDGMLTGLPHLGQNSAPSGSVVPHLLQPRTAGRTPSLADFTGSPHFRQNWAPSGRSVAHLLHNTADTVCSEIESRC